MYKDVLWIKYEGKVKTKKIALPILNIQCTNE